MTDLIVVVRGLINDPTGAEQAFTDEVIQNELDLNRFYNSSLPLIPLPNPDGSIYKWRIQTPHWEKDAVLSDTAGTVLVPDTANYIAGLFTFNEAHEELVITGFCYDVYAVCADLLLFWAGRIEQDITKFSADGSSFEFADTAQSKVALASQFAAKSLKYGGVRVIAMVRNDHVID